MLVTELDYNKMYMDAFNDGFKQGSEVERDKIVSLVEEIAHCTLYCMADMCDREDKNCEKCALEYVINRIKEQKND